MQMKYKIAILVSLILKIVFIYSIPILPEIGDETAHWRYVYEIKTTGHALNHSELWNTGNQTYQASNNPLYYYINSIFPSPTYSRWLSVIISMVAIWMFAKVAMKYGMWWPFLFLAVLPSSIISMSRVGGDSWVYSIILMMVWSYDNRSVQGVKFLTLLIGLVANLRIEGLVAGSILYVDVFWNWYKSGMLRKKSIDSVMVILTIVPLLAGLFTAISRMPLFLSGHTTVTRTLDTLHQISDPLNQAFVSLWFSYGIEQYTTVWILIVPAMFLSWTFTRYFVINSIATWREHLPIILVVVAMVGVFLCHAWVQNASNGRYLLNLIPWMAYVNYRGVSKDLNYLHWNG